MKDWIKKPYPFPVLLQEKIAISIGFGAFVILFLLFFRPFNFSDYGAKVYEVALVFGLITGGTIAFSFTIVSLLKHPALKPSAWTIGKMILFVVSIEILISIVNWFYFHLSAYYNVQNRSFLFALSTTVLIGMFPIFIFLYISENYKRNKHQQVVDAITNTTYNVAPKHKIDNAAQVIINGENKNEAISLLVSQLLFVSYEKNYATIYFLEDGKVKKQILRTTLRNIEDELNNYNYVVRCHKSYLVNTLQVKRMLGNARSYQLEILISDDTKFLIPVSRSFPRELLFTLVNK